MHIIGLVGEKGGGKGTFSKLLQEFLPGKTVAVVRFSDTLSEGLDVFALQKTRENLQKMAVALIEHFGEGTLTNAVKEKVLAQKADIVVVDGIRWMSDFEMFRSLPNNTLIYITADTDIRFQRIKDRKEKAGEAEADYDQFIKEEKAQNEIYIPEIGAHADFTIENNAGIEEFEKKVRGFVAEYL